MRTWKEILSPVLTSPEMTEFKKWLKEERATKNIYPNGEDTLRAFDLCPYRNTKVVIFGQDPYFTPGTADGLAFSSRQFKIPPSLLNIFKEIYTDLNIQYYHNVTFEEFFPRPDLSGWAQNGFLLLNTILTVEQDKPLSHKGKGWEKVLTAAIDALNEHEHTVIFLLWGKFAHELESLISDRHIILKAAHPAAEAYNPGKGGFFGCRHFSIIRDVLPTLHSKSQPGINLNSCFDRTKAAELIKREYPKEADRLIRYVEKEMIIHVPVNESEYIKELRTFEKNLSTKQS